MTYVPKILSGIDVVDTTWGGMYQGGSYMCYGHASNGRGLLGMLFLQMGVVLEEKSLFLSPGRPQDWMIQAASINFDLEEAQQNGRAKLVWIPSVSPQNGVSDAVGTKAIEDLVRLIQAEQPKRVLINDFMPFMQFRSFDRFRQVFGWMMGQLSNVPATVLFMMPDIINVQSKHIVEYMRNQMSGSMHVSIPESNAPGDPRYAQNNRRLVLWPGLGHVNHEVFDPWEIPQSSVHAGNPVRQPNLSSSRSSRNEPATFEGPGSGLAEGISLAGVPSIAVDSLKTVEETHEAFYNKLKKSFKQRATKKYKPFLLVALRMESGEAAVEGSIGLDMLLPAIEKIVQHPDDILVDLSRRRIIAFLPNTKGDNVQEFFESIQEQLREEYPLVADQLPHVVSAVVVPNGQPFETPEDFLAYALEGN